MTLPPPFRLVVLDEVDSTNSEARRRAEAGEPEGALILARRQSAGRGRRGRRWHSPEGNLYMSLLLRPEQPPGDAARLSFVAIVSLADAVGELTSGGLDMALKWPNDLLVNGRKCAGMLLESATAGRGRLAWLVIGIGVNLASHPAGMPWPATDLAREGAAGPTPLGLAEAFARRFLRWRSVWRRRGFAPVRRAWLARAAGLGKPLVVRTETETVHGVFSGLAPDGALLLDREGAVRRFDAGDVFPVGA